MNQPGEVSDSTHQNSSIITKRIKGALRCPKSEALYEQVIQHNFEVIGQLLGKLDSIILRNEQFQFQRVTYGKRICKIQADIQAIHNQYRRQNLFISSKIQQLKLELNGIEKHHKSFLEEVNRKGFKSCKFIDVKMQQFEKSQKCLSNCDTVKYSLNLLDDKINLMSRENIPNFEQASEKINKVESIDSSDRKSTKNIISQTSINKISSFKAMTHIDTRFRRKISKGKIHCKRKSQQFKTNQSLSLKLMQSSQKLGIIKQRIEHELTTEVVEKQIKRNSNQVSWNTSANQQFEVQYQESQDKDELSKNKQYEPVSQENMSMVLNWVCNLMQKIKSQECHQNQSIINYLQAEPLQSKINELQKILNGNKTETQNLQKKWAEANAQFRKDFLNLAQKCSSELFNIKKQIIDLREYVIQNMAGKQQTRDAFMILENRLRNKIMEMANQNPDNSDGLMISKCLSCNRTINNIQQTGTKKGDTIVQMEPNAVKKKFSLSELKKKTIQMIGKMREKEGEREKRQKQRILHKTLDASR